MSAYQFCRRKRVRRVRGGIIALNACKKYIIRISNWDLVPSGTHPWRRRACGTVYTSFILGVFFASFFDEKIKDPYKDVRSAALEVVANNWKSIYSAEICCFQIFHRFATKYLKAYTMLRWIALKFVAAPRKGTVLDPGFLSGNWIRDRSVFMPKNKRSVNNAEIWCFYIFHRFALKYGEGYTMLRWSASKSFITSHQNVEKSEQCWDQPLPNLSLGRARDIGKIIAFQGKCIDFRIMGILENLWFSTKK